MKQAQAFIYCLKVCTSISLSMALFAIIEVRLLIGSKVPKAYFISRNYILLVLEQYFQLIIASFLFVVPMLITFYFYLKRSVKRRQAFTNCRLYLFLIGVAFTVVPIMLLYNCTNWLNNEDLHGISVFQFSIFDSVRWLLAIGASLLIFKATAVMSLNGQEQKDVD